MKKVTLLVVLFSMMTLSTKAQWFDFSQNRNDASIGLNCGVVGYHFSIDRISASPASPTVPSAPVIEESHIDKTYAELGFGASISLLGVYIDFIYQSPEHKWDRTVTQEELPDQTALTINVGYKIPVLPWLNLTPLIGYSNETSGKTLGNSIGVDTDSGSIYHDYVYDNIYNHFNYGIGLSVKPIKWLEIGGVCTSHAVYGNLSVNLMRIPQK